MTFKVIVWVGEKKVGPFCHFCVDGQTVTEAFAQIPMEAAARGFAQLIGGKPVSYEVAIA